ncbi:MAG TPA: immunoglobulin domain-containing protein [Candidatus Sulfotelmatobacter sp.]|nr:immunoglobulin domain-containing protein [Candidatus Sulfotelmatobacter sp.]
MKNCPIRLTVVCVWLLAVHAAATTYYVDINSTNPTPPYTNWATASTDIQSAVNETTNGDLVLVNSGVYGSSGYAAPDGALTTAVITNAITIQSVSGSAETSVNGSNAMRCIYLGNGSTLAGFTIFNGTNGISGDGGGIYCDSTNDLVLNCQVIGNSATDGGGVYSGALVDCVLASNVCLPGGSSGGGAYGSVLNNCAITRNWMGQQLSGATAGAGVAYCIVDNCTLSGNIAYGEESVGGGAYNSTLTNCVIADNVVTSLSDGNGGGAFGGTLEDCMVISNSASSDGGGAEDATLANCLVQGNSGYFGGGLYGGTASACRIFSNGADGGGGAYDCILVNCLIAYNSSTYAGGAAYGGMTNCTVVFNVTGEEQGSVLDCQADNCILYYNTGGDYSGTETINNSCSPILPTSGLQNITNAPLFVDPAGGDFHLLFDSPCVNAGNNAYVKTTGDLDGNPRIVYGTVDMGAYELQSTNDIGIEAQPLSQAVLVGQTATFSVLAASAIPLTYQWLLNGTNIPGATGTNFSISDAQLTNDGVYSVVVSNAFETVGSSDAMLTVLYPANIVQQPASEIVLSNGEASFTVTATGTALNYQWYFNGAALTNNANISGSATPTLNIADVGPGNTGSYTVQITNALTSVTSSNATLETYGQVQITEQPASIGALLGNNATFTVTATGNGLAYQWYFNGMPLTDGGQISGSDSPTLTISDVQSANAGAYTVDITNLISATNSAPALLSIASIRYVNASNSAPTPPYTSWSTAATNIQEAINISTNGDFILVTNGIYGTNPEMLNSASVSITQSVTVQSVNGPGVTTIQGYQVPGTTNGTGAIRCVYMANNSALIGFTLTNGATSINGHGGGIECQSTECLISNCVIVGNSAYSEGAGVYEGTLFNCLITGNVFVEDGGGAYSSSLIDCTIVSNTAASGSGAYNSDLTNCVVADNSGPTAPGASTGGGIFGGNAVNCTITRNTAWADGGAADVTMNNCIVYYNLSHDNSSDSNYFAGSLSYCCTIPLSSGTGNITNAPLLATVSEISPNSPCRGAGNTAVVSGVDINGNPWANPPSIGCEEPNPGNMIGGISLNVAASQTNIEVGYPINFQANISGLVNNSAWDFGNGIVVSNLPYISYTWPVTGSYSVTLTAYNDSYPNGQTVTNIINVYQPTLFYVVQSNSAPIAPYDSWTKAATNIQSAINAAIPDSLILVSNGVYNFGTITNPDGIPSRVDVDQPLTLQSVNGSAATVINGGNTYRCIYLTNGAVLNGFTLTNGNAANGGGVNCASTNAFVENCLIIKNSASSGAAYSGTLSNCTILANSGYGDEYSLLFNCLISSNSNFGAGYSTLNNCVILTNSGGGAYYSTLYNCTILRNLRYGLYGCHATYCQMLNNLQNIDDQGAGAAESFITNCLVSGNDAENAGGGIGDEAVAVNCLIVSNNADAGGGAAASTLINCTVVNNSGFYGGGTWDASLYNCLIYYNTNNGSTYPNNNYDPGTIAYSCTFPTPASGYGNITNAPLFVNLAGGDFHLQSSSPCINSGNNAYISSATDLDGNPRIVGGTVDIGAYEYQTPTSVISYAYLQQYGLPTDGSVDFADLDGTAFNVYQDWIAGLNPTNPASVLAMLTPVVTTNATGITVTWQSVSGIPYILQRSTNLASQPPFSTIQNNITGQSGTTSYTDTSATNNVPYFYRAGVVAP